MRKILIIEDDPIVQDLVYAILAGDPRYHILQARDGNAGLAMLRQEKPDLVFLDIDLPLMNGIDLCRIAKNDPDTAATRIIMLTAMSQESDIAEGRAAGAEDYFIKPFSPLSLLRKVDDIMGR